MSTFSLKKRVKLFYVVFPLHTWVVSPSVRGNTHTQQYICQTHSKSVPAMEYFTTAGEMGMEVGNQSVYCIVVSLSLCLCVCV